MCNPQGRWYQLLQQDSPYFLIFSCDLPPNYQHQPVKPSMSFFNLKIIKNQLNRASNTAFLIGLS